MSSNSVITSYTDKLSKMDTQLGEDRLFGETPHYAILLATTLPIIVLCI